MADYKHGAYGLIQAAGNRVAASAGNAFVYVGTAPVHMVEGGAENVNVPVLVNNIAEAKQKFGYSEDFASYTLCEAMHVHFELNGVGPLVFINVLDPAKHKKAEQGTQSLTPENGRIVIHSAQDVVLDSVVVTKGGEEGGDLKKGEDYSIACDLDKKSITITELKSGALGTEAATVKYDQVDASQVKDADVIGSSDGLGLNTGLFAIKNVYQVTGFIPSFLMAPGFSGIPAVHTAMIQNSRKINSHWDAYVLADIPIIDSEETPVTLDTAKTWKAKNGYTNDNESVYFPLAQGTDGLIYHISVLAAANLQLLLLEQDGRPYRTASNTDCGIIQNLYLGEENKGRVYDDYIINEKLNKNGINSAAYVGGRWAIWGAHSASYDQENGDQINVSETNRMMLFYISNDFQHRRTRNVDKPLTANDIASIVSEEQARLDALMQTGALCYGYVEINADAVARSDVYQGDYSFTFQVTTTPLAKSLTAIVSWTDAGFVTYFANFDAM